VALVVCGAMAGCGNEEAERESRQVAQRFHAGVERGDGASACAQLTEAAVDELEKSEEKPCEQAVLSLNISAARAAAARVYQTSAAVDLVEGGTDFLNKTNSGWRLSAAGCDPRPGRPYECELED
jgi:hypothetical protein